ncbi:MAG: ATP-dependent sacrificial sulfur transferase LarE [Thermodesulfobacteriota bacterium]
MELETKRKYEALKGILTNLDSVLVAFSGGVDSGLLLRAAAEVLPAERLLSVTARSGLNPPGELETATGLAARLAVRHEVVAFDPLELEPVRHNSRERCYHCKTALARLLRAKAARTGLAYVVEGSHAGDLGEHRPGKKALAEAGIFSPLHQAGLVKDEIRALARDLGLENWDRPTQACLATRFPYGVTLEPAGLRQVFEAEAFLAREGLFGVRARHHGRILRLEFPAALEDRIAEAGLRRRLAEGLAALGFTFVTLDLAGYRSGVFDRVEDHA